MHELDYTFIATLRKPLRFNRVKNLTGQRFNRLTAFSFLGITLGTKSRAIWLCRCDCGKFLTVVGNDLTTGNTQSCGCYKRQRTIETFTTHGMRRSREYKKYSMMMSRCFDPNNVQASDYSERGITVCEYLRDFTNFYAELGPLPTRAYSTDRPDNNGGYWCGHCEQCIQNEWPHNIRWATRSQQDSNKRTSRLITANGETKCLAEWCRHVELDYFKVRDRIKRGWTPEQALGLEVRPIREGHRADGSFDKNHQPHNLRAKNL